MVVSRPHHSDISMFWLQLWLEREPTLAANGCCNMQQALGLTLQ